MTTASPTLASTGSDFAHRIGRLYATWTLDGLVEIAHAVSLDFVSRPQMYTGDSIPESIVDLRIAYGTDRNFQNTDERLALMLPILGRSDGLKPDASTATSSFHLARKKFFDACIAFAERAVDTGVAALEQRVRSSLVTFQTPFTLLNGHATKLAARSIHQVSEHGIQILQSPGVAKVFGQVPPSADWPFAARGFLDDSNANGAKLVEAAGFLSGLAADYKFSSTRFVLLQKLAQEGGAALPLILSTDPAGANVNEIADVIARGYSWATSLRDYQQTA
jgi:hypothetical protein